MAGLAVLLSATAIGAAPFYQFQETLPVDGAVAVFGDHMVIGLTRSYPDNGSIITYERHGKFWVESQRIHGTDFYGNFGAITKFWDDNLIVVAPLASTGGGDPARGNGVVYRYEHDGISWLGETLGEGSLHEGFGARIATAGDTMMMSSPSYSGNFENLVGERGQVYAYNRTAEGVRFHSLLQQSNAPNEWDAWATPGWDEGDRFGEAIAMSEDRVLVTAPLENSSATGIGGDPDNEEATNSGAAYLYELQGEQWVETTYLKPTNTTAGNKFGRSAAMSGDRLAIGDHASVHVYLLNGQEWELRQMIPSTHRPVMNGDTMLIGADLYCFDPATNEWVLSQTLPVDPQSSALFAGTELYMDGKIFTTDPPQKLFVNAAHPAVGDGSSWENAFRRLQDAIAAARANPGSVDEIWIAGGTYFPDDGVTQTPQDRASTFNLPPDITLRGGFQGTETELSQRQPEAFPTVLSGDIDHDDTDPNRDGIIESASEINGANARHVVTVQDIWVRLDHLVITAGDADGTAADSQGAGALVDEGGLILQNCRLQGNAATGDGGAINGYLSTLDLEDCQLTGNLADDDGAAIYAWASTCQIRRARISGNSATDRAGGIYITATSGYVADSLLSGNVALNSGGGIYVKRVSTFGVFACTVAGNYAEAGGGGLFMEVGVDGVATPDVIIDASVFWGNSTIEGTAAESASGNFSDEGVNVVYQPFAVVNRIQMGEELPADDPQFVDPIVASTTPDVGGDYHLSTTSPLINQIDSIINYQFAPFLDLDRKQRVQGGLQNFGAYEEVVPAEQTFEERFPNLPRGGDANGNGLSNLLDYESGSDPQAPPSGRPALSIWNLGGTPVLDYYEHPNSGAKLILEASHDLSGPWLEIGDVLVWGTDYTGAGSSVNGVPVPDRDPTKSEFAVRRIRQILTGEQLYFRLRVD